MVGRGAYGEVYQARDARDGTIVAVKHVRKAFEYVREAVRVLRELKFLRILSGHPNVVGIRDVLPPGSASERFDDIFIVFEFLPATLKRAMSLLSANAQFSVEYKNKLVKKFMYDLLCGLKYMHSAHIHHRDLKPDNLLVENLPNTVRLCLCDLGLARAEFDTNENFVFWTGYVETRWYRAPELLMCQATQYSTAIDIWSAGCILAEMLVGGKPLFAGRDGLHQLELMMQYLGKPDVTAIGEFRSAKVREHLRQMPERPGMDFDSLFPDADLGALQLLRAMLQFDPRMRPTAAQALMHPYFDDVDQGRAEENECAPVDEAEFVFERVPLDRDQIRDLFRLEIRQYYHQELFPELAGATVSDQGVVIPSPEAVAAASAATATPRSGDRRAVGGDAAGAYSPESSSASPCTTTHYETPSELRQFNEQVKAQRIGYSLKQYQSMPKEKILELASRVVAESNTDEEMSESVRSLSIKGSKRLGGGGGGGGGEDSSRASIERRGSIHRDSLERLQRMSRDAPLPRQ